MFFNSVVIKLSLFGLIILTMLGLDFKPSQSDGELEAYCCLYAYETTYVNSYTINDPITCRDLWSYCASANPSCYPSDPDKVICSGSSITINQTVTKTEYWYSASAINIDCDVSSPGSGWENIGKVRVNSTRQKYSVRTEPFTNCSGVISYNFQNCSQSDFTGCLDKLCAQYIYPPGWNQPVPPCVQNAFCSELKSGDNTFYGPILTCK